MLQVTVEEAKVQLSDLIDAAVMGESVYIVQGEQPIVQLVPMLPVPRRRQFGSARGLIEMTEEFDDPLADLEAYKE